MSSEPPVNPYAPPAILVDPAVADPARLGPPYQLYSQGAVALAAFLGSFAAGAVLLALNFLRVGKAGAAYGILAAGLLVQGAIFAVAMVLPEDAPSFLFAIGQTALAYGLAVGLQRQILERHQSQGGQVASLWWAVGISLVVAIVVFALFIGVLLLIPEQWWPVEA
jgi:hypothetical protein